ncbi:zinc metallopeptidase [Vagococcus entomophilus]|uniref:Peptidase n=1 Tax=Vagococcus entomophilus TaxID=1160095 RepID=A0A430AHZ0_9ENTE|nr:zinc metallopeptidase [Vagococcus entomophilus]RSU07732.1 peptidase [Vagococcus entomophilus]
MGSFYFGFDRTFILVIIGMLLSMAASGYVNYTYQKYSKVRNKKGYTGEDAARFILNYSGIHNVGVQQISGDLTDNYNAQTKVLSLSQAVGPSSSVAALGVAAHECGHAVQDQVNYTPLKLRASLVPVANIGSTVSIPLIILGVILGGSSLLINIGIFCFSLAFLFQVVTLPVEFNASRRALAILKEGNILDAEELPMARQVLIAAALTYVAAAVATLLQLVRLIILFGGNRRDD